MMSEEDNKKRSLRAWLFEVIVKYLITLGIFLIVLFVFASVFLGGSARKGPVPVALQNAKQVGYALFNFENDHGCYPNDETINDLGHDVILSSTRGSNFYFSQLIAGGYVDQESPFYAHTDRRVDPDGERSTPDELLAPGEVGFAYVLWSPSMNSGNLPAEAPLLLSYVEAVRREWLRPSTWFKTRERRLVVLRVDMSVAAHKSTLKGAVNIDGKDYFDWSQPHWGGQKPKIVWPE